MKNSIYIVLGTISLILGLIGIVLPLLPTTPFLLLTAWLYMRSSTKLYNKLMNHKRLGNYIKCFNEDKAIPLHAKVISISLMCLTIAYSAFFVVETWWVRLILLAVAIAVSIHILSFATKK